MDKWTVLYNRLWIFMSFPPWTTCLSFYEWVFISATWYPALTYCCSLIGVRGKNSAPCCPSSLLTSKLEFSSLAEQSLTSWAISGWTRTEPSLILLGDLGRLMKPSWANRFGQHLGPWFHVTAKEACLPCFGSIISWWQLSFQNMPDPAISYQPLCGMVSRPRLFWCLVSAAQNNLCWLNIIQ